MNTKLTLLLLGLIVIVFFTSCKKYNEDKCKVILLKVDYMTYTFEGGHEQTLSGKLTSADTIPITIDFDPPGDFGNISLYYNPTGELIFDGSIVWMGTGKIKYPKTFRDSHKYIRLNDSISLPDTSKIQNIDTYIHGIQLDYPRIWDSIDDLLVVSEYLKSHKKIYLFLYQPSVGVGDPNTWDWFVIMNK